MWDVAKRYMLLRKLCSCPQTNHAENAQFCSGSGMQHIQLSNVCPNSRCNGTAGGIPNTLLIRCFVWKADSHYDSILRNKAVPCLNVSLAICIVK
jgi:hypothetical protein